MNVQLKALAAFLRRRGGMLGCDNFADVITLTMMGLPPAAAVERSLDVAYPQRLTRKAGNMHAKSVAVSPNCTTRLDTEQKISNSSPSSA